MLARFRSVAQNISKRNTIAFSVHRNYPTLQQTVRMASGSPSQSHADAAQRSADASSGSPNSLSMHSLGIRQTQINQAAGVDLSSHQKILVGSVLDLFAGHPTLPKLSLWSRDGSFQDPITQATGFDKFAAQWYGLPAVFNPIETLSHRVTSAGNPIELELRNKYVLKGIKTEQTIDSRVLIHVGADGKIERVEDRWNDKLPASAVSQAFRKLNAVTVPAFVKVPKNEEEDNEMKRERESL